MSSRTELAVAPALEAPIERLLTPAQAAERLAVSRSMIYSLIRRGALSAFYVGRLPRISERSFAAYLAGTR
jgi:excisionase family DNA binding protein